jgi:hypothetical protein
MDDRLREALRQDWIERGWPLGDFSTHKMMEVWALEDGKSVAHNSAMGRAGTLGRKEDLVDLHCGDEGEVSYSTIMHSLDAKRKSFLSRGRDLLSSMKAAVASGLESQSEREQREYMELQREIDMRICRVEGNQVKKAHDRAEIRKEREDELIAGAMRKERLARREPHAQFHKKMSMDYKRNNTGPS